MMEEQQGAKNQNEDNKEQTAIESEEPKDTEPEQPKETKPEEQDGKHESQVKQSEPTTSGPQNLNAPATSAAATTTATATVDPAAVDDDDHIEDDFVVVTTDEDFWYESNRHEYFAQMEAFFTKQIEMCDHYRRYFEQHENFTMETRFAGYSVSSGKHLEIIRKCIQRNEILPRFEFEQVAFSCLPINLDIPDKRMQIVVRTKDFPKSSSDAIIFCVGEFEFPYTKDESFLESLRRWRNSVAIEPQNLVCCSSRSQKQIDRIYATDKKSFTEPGSKFVEFDRPLEFFVDKGKSRTLKRKFKNVKLTFYEKSGLFKSDKKIGSLQVKIDAINDEHRFSAKIKLNVPGRENPCTVEFVIRVREPLTNKLPRSHIERILVLK